ncbi:MAG: hypothetical protein VX569_06785 [Pseudomonadota bacterium]|nr:hypothetical protein [Pseudomonadota bacterium]
MTESGMNQAPQSPIESVLADELARGDVVLGTAGPMLGMLLANYGHGLFSDEVVARVRGMVSHAARQLLYAQANAAGLEDPAEFAAPRCDDLAEAIGRELRFLGHCHALALEYRLAIKLEARSTIDPVLSPGLQAMIASPDGETARLAMQLLASQARFIQQQRRMELPLDELPRALFDHVLATWRGQADGTDENAIEQASQRLRDGHAERTRRLDLLAKAAAAVTGGGQPLAIGQFGVALFLSALAEQSGQEREIVALATDESQVGRLALALRAAGLKHDQVAEQFLLVHPEITLPDAFDTLKADRAATLLAGSGRKELG